MTEQLSLFDHPPAFVGPVSKHPAYRVWCCMMTRCHNPNDLVFRKYGARGIFVCDEWRGSSRAFIAWADANGYCSGLQLDREDNDGPYSPGNCRFVTPRQNVNNRRNTLRLSDGTPLADAARAAGLSRHTVHKRLLLGWSPDDAATVPVVDRRKHFLSDGSPLADAARAAGLSFHTVRTRLRLGWSPDEAVSVPKGGKRPIPFDKGKPK